ncbi:MAG: hypothetical protein FJW96_04605 [Actinobacteria bacterium]|nr:hypothetical protein [Actinomycetota bacterium]
MPIEILIPLAILGGLLLLLAVTAILSRVAGGRYLRPVAMLLAKIGPIRRAMHRMSLNQLEKTNPELASAMRKLQAFGEPTSVDAAQRALRVLTPAERKAYTEAAGEQQGGPAQPEPPNRQLRRRMEHGGAGMPMRQSGPSSTRPGAAGRRTKKKR